LFGEKYAETVRTISIGEEPPMKGVALTSTKLALLAYASLKAKAGHPGSGDRCVTGRAVYELVQHRFRLQKKRRYLAASPG
jgi:hypothetical protein